MAPPLLVLIMLVSANRRIMGKRTNNRLTNALGWLTAGVMFLGIAGVIATSI